MTVTTATPKKRDNYAMLCVPKATKEMLNVLRKDMLSYAKVIDYLLIKSKHLSPEHSSINYKSVDEFINGHVE